MNAKRRAIRKNLLMGLVALLVPALIIGGGLMLAPLVISGAAPAGQSSQVTHGEVQAMLFSGSDARMQPGFRPDSRPPGDRHAGLGPIQGTTPQRHDTFGLMSSIALVSLACLYGLEALLRRRKAATTAALPG